MNGNRDSFELSHIRQYPVATSWGIWRTWRVRITFLFLIIYILSSAVKITAPVGAYWDETSFNVVNAGGSIVKNEWVVFESSTATGISDEGVRMKNDGWNATDVYDLQGRRISTSPQALKHGIYIINGQKVVVR